MITSALNLLQLEQASLKRQKACAHNKCQPICDLPDEVLTLIFEVGLPAPSEQWQRDPRENPETQWTLRQYQEELWSIAAVCGRFRAVLLDSPNCWAYVSYLLDACTVSTAKKRLEALEIVLARSKGALFDFNLEVVTRGIDAIAPIEAASCILLPHMHRCRRIYLKSNDRGADLPFLENSAHPLHSLQYLALDLFGDENWNSREEMDGKAGRTISSLAAAVTLPLLSLTLKTGHFLNVRFEAIGTGLLTRLRIDGPCRIKGVAAILSSCQSLEHLHWAVQSMHEEPLPTNAPIPSISLQRLISLQTDAHPPRNLPSGISLDAPRLEQIICRSGDLSGDFIDIFDPKRASFPSLLRISLPYTLSNDPRLASFVRRHPHLVEVQLVTSSGPPSFLIATIDSLACCWGRPQHAPSPGLCQPSLELNTHTIYFSSFIACIENTMRKTAHLQLRIHLGPPKNLRDVARVVQCFEKSKFAARVQIDPPQHLSDLWPDAWGIWDKPGFY